MLNTQSCLLSTRSSFGSLQTFSKGVLAFCKGVLWSVSTSCFCQAGSRRHRGLEACILKGSSIFPPHRSHICGGRKASLHVLLLLGHCRFSRKQVESVVKVLDQPTVGAPSNMSFQTWWGIIACCCSCSPGHPRLQLEDCDTQMVLSMLSHMQAGRLEGESKVKCPMVRT